jgi:hypothetical protein
MSVVSIDVDAAEIASNIDLDLSDIASHIEVDMSNADMPSASDIAYEISLDASDIEVSAPDVDAGEVASALLDALIKRLAPKVETTTTDNDSEQAEA